MSGSDNDGAIPMACNGEGTIERWSANGGMEECAACGMSVRHDLTDHKFFGFVASCSRWKQIASKT